MSSDTQTQAGTPIIERSKRIAKRAKISPNTRTLLFRPIDEVIGQCVDIHKTLQRSNQLLRDFDAELRTITEYLDQMRVQDHPDDLTVWNTEAQEPRDIDHRRLFARLEDERDGFETECSAEQFCREVLTTKNTSRTHGPLAPIGLPGMRSVALYDASRGRARLSSLAMDG